MRNAIYEVVGERANIIAIQVRVPHTLGIDDGVGAVEARSEAPTRRDQDVDRAARDQLALHARDQRVTAAPTARGLPRRALVRTDEEMARHSYDTLRSSLPASPPEGQ
jgi:hypothetical protein